MNLEIGKCLNCGKETQKKLLCTACDPNEGQNSLPSDMEEDTIQNMKDGEVGYTVPWAMFANPMRRLFIVGTYTIHPQPGGTVCMKIKKQDGQVLVEKESIRDHKYTPDNPCYVGVSPDSYISVRLVEEV